LLKLNKRCKIQFNNANWKGISQEAVDAVLTLMEIDPVLRPSAEEALEHPWLKMHTSTKPSKNSSLQKYYSHLTFKDSDELLYSACNSNFLEESKSNLEFDSEFPSKETRIFTNFKLSEDCLKKFEESSSYLSICFLDAVGFNTASFDDGIGFIQKLDGDIDPMPMGTFEFD
jgi:serine/threonine protein kinase